MKKLALAFASLALVATPVFACPHSDKAEDAAAPKTAKKKEAPKADSSKETAGTEKPAEKTPAKPDKVSQK